MYTVPIVSVDSTAPCRLKKVVNLPVGVLPGGCQPSKKISALYFLLFRDRPRRRHKTTQSHFQKCLKSLSWTRYPAGQSALLTINCCGGKPADLFSIQGQRSEQKSCASARESIVWLTFETVESFARIHTYIIYNHFDDVSNSKIQRDRPINGRIAICCPFYHRTTVIVSFRVHMLIPVFCLHEGCTNKSDKLSLSKLKAQQSIYNTCTFISHPPPSRF